MSSRDPGPSVDPITDALVALLRETGVGNRIPGERELAERLDVSRTLLRDRIGSLEALGVLERRTGSGTFVRGLDPQVLGRALTIGLLLAEHTEDSLLDVRIALERQAAQQAALRQDRVAVARLFDALDGIEGAVDLAAEIRADVEFHTALLHAAGNGSIRFFATALDVALRRSIAERRVVMEAVADRHAVMSRVHRAIAEAVAAGEPGAAMRAVDEHFRCFDSVTSLHDE